MPRAFFMVILLRQLLCVYSHEAAEP